MRLQLLAGCLLATMFLAPYGYAQQRGQQQGSNSQRLIPDASSSALLSALR